MKLLVSIRLRYSASGKYKVVEFGEAEYKDDRCQIAHLGTLTLLDEQNELVECLRYNISR